MTEFTDPYRRHRAHVAKITGQAPEVCRELVSWSESVRAMTGKELARHGYQGIVSGEHDPVVICELCERAVAADRIAEKTQPMVN